MNWFSMICAQTGNRKWFSGPDGFKWFAKEFDKRPQVTQFCRDLSTYYLFISTRKIRKQKTVFFWPNGVASYRKLKTCENSRLRLTMTCVCLWWLAILCVQFDWAQICTQANAFFIAWPPNASRRKLGSVLVFLVQPALKWIFAKLQLTCVHLWARMAATHRKCALRTQIGIFKLALTCDSAWPGLIDMPHGKMCWKESERASVYGTPQEIKA